MGCFILYMPGNFEFYFVVFWCSLSNLFSIFFIPTVSNSSDTDQHWHFVKLGPICFQKLFSVQQVTTSRESVIVLLQSMVKAHVWCIVKGMKVDKRLFEPRYEISNNVVCATSKGSDQPAHMCSLIRIYASRLNILVIKLLTIHHLEFLSLTGGLSESTLVKMPHCWKSHVTAHLLEIF